MSRRVTQSDIARACGLSKATVSWALRDDPRIPPTTRDRILEAARDLGYRRDPAVSALAEYRWHGAPRVKPTIAYIADFDEDFTRPQTKARAGGRAAAEALGYAWEEIDLHEFPSRKRASKVLYHRGIRGILIGPSLYHPDFYEGFDWEPFSAVCCHLAYPGPHFDVVVPDMINAMNRAWEEVLQLGYRRIGVVLPDDGSMRLNTYKVAAFHLNEAIHGAEIDTVPVLRSAKGEIEPFLEWVARHQPDVVIGRNDDFHAWLIEAGHRVPEEIGFVSLGLWEEDSGISGVHEDLPLIGQTAVEILDARIRANHIGSVERARTIMVESAWIPGRTIRSQ